MEVLPPCSLAPLTLAVATISVMPAISGVVAPPVVALPGLGPSPVVVARWAGATTVGVACSRFVARKTDHSSIASMQLTKRMDRAYKFTLGERINNTCVDILLSVYRINIASAGRERFFVSAREQVKLVRLLLRLLKDLRLAAIKRFAALNEYVESISKQLTGCHNNHRNPSYAKGNRPSGQQQMLNNEQPYIQQDIQG